MSLSVKGVLCTGILISSAVNGANLNSLDKVRNRCFVQTNGEHVQGLWVLKTCGAQGNTHEVKRGFSLESSQSMEARASMEVSFQFAITKAAKVEAGLAATDTSTKSEETSETYNWSQDGYQCLWQWQWQARDKCGDEMTLRTSHTAWTDFADTPPRCHPGMCASDDARNRCCDCASGGILKGFEGEEHGCVTPACNEGEVVKLFDGKKHIEFKLPRNLNPDESMEFDCGAKSINHRGTVKLVCTSDGVADVHNVNCTRDHASAAHEAEMRADEWVPPWEECARCWDPKNTDAAYRSSFPLAALTAFLISLMA